MRIEVPEKLERGRIVTGRNATPSSFKFTGAFRVQGPCGAELTIIASDATLSPWEHVSVSTNRRAPNWQEMCFVKDLFWDEEECVMQLHPPKSEWVNNHSYCLHLWKPIQVEIPRPPSIMVGIKKLGTLNVEK